MAIGRIYHSENLPRVLEDRRRPVSGERRTVLRELRYVRKDLSVGWANCGLSWCATPPVGRIISLRWFRASSHTDRRRPP